jgi:hypothetical protein
MPARLMVSAGLAVTALGMVLFTLGGAGSDWTLVLPGELVAFAGVGLFNPAVIGVALGSVGPEHSGVAAGASTMFRLAGVSVGVAALGALVPAQDALGGGDPAAYVAGYHHALLVGAALAAAGALVSAALIPGARRRAGTAAVNVSARPVPEPA